METTEIQKLTISELKSFPELGNLSPKEADKIIATLFELSIIAHNIIVQKKHRNVEFY